ncbi:MULTISPECIES: PLDc N-terminal domain-containing protein [unclassified Curtobacterium]|uniref:PLDc N-terminal domain-containing protein n=1 Tax=unclassified Curtobacterium TaxID=257496 RepID=UPI00104CF8D3|nr:MULTISPECIES: PLDc N-terminal domain-containing protein [unclassified Curtobacterium]
MDLSESHVFVLLLMLTLEVLAIVQVWRDRRRTLVVKVLWTLVILALPVIGVLGWAVNWLLGKAAEALQRRNA